MSFEEFKNLTYRDPEPKEKVNTHWMTSVNDGDRFCIYRKLYQYYDSWWNPFSKEYLMEIETKTKLKRLDSRVKRLEMRKRKQRALQKLWSNFEHIINSPDTVPAVNFFQNLTPA